MPPRDSLQHLARHWLNQTANGKGMRLSPDQLDLLNVIGAGELLAIKAAEEQRAKSEARLRDRSAKDQAGQS